MLMPHFINLRKCCVILRNLRVFCESFTIIREHYSFLRKGNTFYREGFALYSLSYALYREYLVLHCEISRYIEIYLCLFAKVSRLFAINAQSLGARQKFFLRDISKRKERLP